MTDDLETCTVRGDRGEKGLGVGRQTVGRIAQVDGRRGLAGDDVVRDSGFESGHRDDLVELEPTDDGRPRIELEQRLEAADCPLESAVREPRSGRVTARP